MKSWRTTIEVINDSQNMSLYTPHVDMSIWGNSFQCFIGMPCFLVGAEKRRKTELFQIRKLYQVKFYQQYHWSKLDA